jgi:hypothetical protein
LPTTGPAPTLSAFTAEIYVLFTPRQSSEIVSEPAMRLVTTLDA